VNKGRCRHFGQKYFTVFQTRGRWETWYEGHWGTLERPQKFVFEATRGAKNDIMGTMNVNVSIGEN
jgi:hypothetical protein